MAKARSRDVSDDARIDDSGRAAIRWMVILTSGSMTDRQLRDFDSWRGASPRNAEAWNRISGGLEPFDILARSGLPRGTVSRLPGQTVRADRRAVLAGLAGLVALGGAGTASLHRFVPFEDILNDHYTRTAEQDRFSLSDGSQIVLAPRSSINVALTRAERSLEFVRGQMMLDVNARDSRPFTLDMGAFRLDASSGSFVLNRRDERLSVAVLTGSGTVEGRGRTLTLRSSERLSFSGGDIVRSKVDIEAASAWTTGIAVIDDESIANIIEQIRPYYAGFIRISPEIADRHATGVFNLFDPVAALDTLAQSVGLKMTQTAGFWIKIGPTA